jgi:hypothetical protein
MKKLNNEELLAELEVPFPVDQVLWRVTNTANNRTRGQVVPYAPWVDIDEKIRPKKSPAIAPWMVPENWRKAQRPSGKAAESNKERIELLQ